MTAAHDDPSTSRVLRRLELLITRRVVGAVHGDYRGIFPGPGTEIGDGRPYVPGDDVRLIDWNLTARTNEPHTRDRIRDHELDAWLVLDLSASLGPGTRGGRKRDLALFAAAAFGLSLSQTANRVGAVLIGDGAPRLVPPHSGRAHLMALLRQAEELATAAVGGTARTDLIPALQDTARYARRRGFVAVVSDFLVGPGWAAPLHLLCQAHTVTVVHVTDPMERELPVIGRVLLQDPETGTVVHADTGSPRLRARYRAAMQEHDAELERALTHSGANLLTLGTEQDWTAQVVQHFRRQRALHRGYRRTPWRG